MILNRYVNIQNWGRFSFNIYEGKLGALYNNRILLYSLFGSALDSHRVVYTDTHRKAKNKSSWDFLFGFGLTAILWEKNLKNLDNSVLRLGIDGKWREVDFIRRHLWIRKA